MLRYRYTRRIADKKILFVDTETSGIPLDQSLSYRNIDNWPPIKQIAWILYTKDGSIVSQHNYMMQEDSSSIAVNSSNYIPCIILPIHEVLIRFKNTLERCDVIVGHNIGYDVQIISCEMHRYGYDTELLHSLPQFCTMKNSIKICGFNTRNGDWYPKLQELYSKLFHRPFDYAHDAYCDIKATAECFWKMFSEEMLNKEDFPFLLPYSEKTEKANSYLEQGKDIFDRYISQRVNPNNEELESALSLFEKALFINPEIKDKVGKTCMRREDFLCGDSCNESFFKNYTNSKAFRLVQEAILQYLLQRYDLFKWALSKDDTDYQKTLQVTSYTVLHIVKCYFDGIGTAKNLTEAKKWINVGMDLWSKQKNTRAVSDYYYYLGLYNEENNRYEDALSCYINCKSFCPAASKRLGIMYLNGLGCKKSKSQARLYLNEAKNKGLDVTPYLDKANSWF